MAGLHIKSILFYFSEKSGEQKGNVLMQFTLKSTCLTVKDADWRVSVIFINQCDASMLFPRKQRTFYICTPSMQRSKWSSISGAFDHIHMLICAIQILIIINYYKNT